MDRFQKRRLKRKIYGHINHILYTIIFLMASVITLMAALGRDDSNVSQADVKHLSVMDSEAIGIDNGESIKVAVADPNLDETLSEREDETENMTFHKEVVTEQRLQE